MLYTKVIETTTTTGTGTMTLSGANGTGNRSFGTAAGTGNKVFYYRETSDGATWELGWGVVTVGPPDTLTRNLIASSSGSLINWSAGTHFIFSTPPQEILASELLENTQSSATRPTWLQAGGNWADKSGTPWVLYNYDGTNDVPLGTLDATNHAWNPRAYSADAGATEGPTVDLWRNSASPAAADNLGIITFSGESSTSVTRVLAKLRARFDTTTNAAEDATVEAHSIIGGTLTKIFEWGKKLTLFKAVEMAKAADVASATSCDIWTPGGGNLVHVTGTTTITSFATAPQAGAWRHIIFDGVLTLTHGASAIVLPGGANITTAAGDEAWVLADTTTKHLVHYQRADGKPIVPTFLNSYAKYSYTQASGSNDATAVVGTTYTKLLINTEDNDADGIGTLASDQITLVAGKYRTRCRATLGTVSSSNTFVGLRLRNTTGATTVLVGDAVGAGTNGNICPAPELVGEFTIAASQALELQYYASTTGLAALSRALSSGEVEVHRTLEFWRVS